MQTIQQQALQTYQQNLEYFKKNHPQLYAKIINFDNAIGNGHLKERYLLEYKEEGYFDIQDTITSEWLYGENSLEYSKKLVELINFKKSEGTFYGLKQIVINDNDAAIIDQTILHFHNSLWATAKIINYHNNKVSPDSHMRFIFKFIFIDVGLGLHIPLTIQKTNAKVIFIQEESLELFRLSLFVTNYQEISQNCKILFSIEQNNESGKNLFLEFLDEGFNYNFHMKYLPFYKQYQDKLKKLQFFVYQQPHFGYPYSAILLRNVFAPKYIYENYIFTDLSKRRSLSLFNKLPTIIVASGPSTKKEIEWLKANKDKLIIVSPLSTCRFLALHGIKPHIVIHIDPQANETALLFNDLAQNYFDQTIAILSNNVDEITIKRFKKENVFCIEQGTHFKANFGGLSAPSVGEYAYALLLLLGVKELYLLGIDFALDTQTLATHSGEHPFERMIEHDAQSATTPNVHANSIKYISGNFEEKVPSLSGYEISITQFNYFAKHLQAKEQIVYNLSHGAKLLGAIPRKTNDVEVSTYQSLSQKEVFDNLHHCLKSISEESATTNDKKLLQKEIKGTNALLKIIEHFATKAKSPATYIDELSDFHDALSGLGTKEKLNIHQVYLYFFKTVFLYIFDMINTQELERDNLTIIKEIDALLSKQTKKIALFYIEKLEDYM